jgi:hypothetical protein
MTSSAPATDESEAGAPLALSLGKEVTMLWTLALILFVLWLLGTVSAYTMGGLIHALLVLALILVVVNLFTGTRRAAL